MNDVGVSQLVRPSDEIASLVKAAAHSPCSSGPEAIFRKIVLASPHQLNGQLHVPCHERSLPFEIATEAAAKTTADKRHVHRYIVGSNIKGLRDILLGAVAGLRRCPYFTFAVFYMDGRVHRLHVAMRQEREFVDGFHFYRQTDLIRIDRCISPMPLLW